MVRRIFVRNSGPLSHLPFWIIVSTVRPLLASSAGLNSEFTYLHWLGLECSWITVRRLDTNVWNLADSFLMYRSTVVESVQNTDWCNGISSSDLRSHLIEWPEPQLRFLVSGLSSAWCAQDGTSPWGTSSKRCLTNPPFLDTRQLTELVLNSMTQGISQLLTPSWDVSPDSDSSLFTTFNTPWWKYKWLRLSFVLNVRSANSMRDWIPSYKE